MEHKLPNGANAEEDPPKVDAQAIGAALRGLLVAAYPNYTFDLGSGYLTITALLGRKSPQSRPRMATPTSSSTRYWIQSRPWRSYLWLHLTAISSRFRARPTVAPMSIS
ncbi:tail fiber protein / tail tubular protein A [Enterobacter phage 01_vB_Eclo_IJM]|nr:tail fiber protein / tail tubular protein A [Enterobacter phage 01_vB_Eclo_IJM]